jgi:hypothetical protein
MKSTQKQQQGRSGNSLKLFDYFPDSKQHLLLLLLVAPARSSPCCRAKKQLLDVALCVSVSVCVSLSLHVQMLRVFFTFPSFLHRVAHHHHSKWDNHWYQWQQKHSYPSLEKMAQKEFSSSPKKWVQEQQFLFCKKLPKQHAIHEKTEKKKFFLVFLSFMGCSLNWVFVRFMSS